MQYHDYERAVQEGYQLNQSGDPVGAARLFTELAAEPDQTDMDRVYMLHNAAVCLQQVGPAEEVERLFDEAAEIERRWCRSTAREAKARWLESAGRREDAVAIYTELMNEGWVTLKQRRDFEDAIFRTRP